MNQKFKENGMEEGLKAKRYLTPKEVERIYGLSEKWLANMRWEKKWIPYVKVGWKILYKPEDVENFIEKHRVKVIKEENI